MEEFHTVLGYDTIGYEDVMETPGLNDMSEKEEMLANMHSQQPSSN
jgi:hypothetical protein